MREYQMTNLQGNLAGVFAVPPLARRQDPQRTLDFEQNTLIARHIIDGGIRRLLYGGNAFLYHISLAEFDQVLDWLSDLPEDVWAIPGIGPNYGVAMDQAALLRRHHFPGAMILPCGDPRDAVGLEAGYREIADAAQTKLIVYLKDETNFGPDRAAGLDAIARLVNDGICIAIKYAVVRNEPAHDSYLEALLERIDRKFVISGIGERPAVAHLRDWQLPGFTTGSGCIAPRLTQELFAACQSGDFEKANEVRAEFIPLEDLRDAWGPAKVLHAATDLAGIAATGPLPPFTTGLAAEQLESLAPIARRLLESNKAMFVSSTLAGG
jgi:dihydrodipicolinate synthase/N-acetylneuraminate lyase